MQINNTNNVCMILNTNTHDMLSCHVHFHTTVQEIESQYLTFYWDKIIIHQLHTAFVCLQGVVAISCLRAAILIAEDLLFYGMLG